MASLGNESCKCNKPWRDDIKLVDDIPFLEQAMTDDIPLQERMTKYKENRQELWLLLSCPPPGGAIARSCVFE
jgi:hypothetical protein